MLTEICAYLHNWFDIDEYHKKLPHIAGKITIENGVLDGLSDLVINGQLFYIYGSILNDGVYMYNDELELKDESFIGLVQSMRVEPDFLKIAADIEAWDAKYNVVGNEALSPFNSESFGGYSYSKSSGSNSSGSATTSPAIMAYAGKLNRWRKI